MIYGGVSVNHQTDALHRGCHICVATPGRLEDFIKRGKVIGIFSLFVWANLSNIRLKEI